MTYVVTEACIKCKHMDCVEVCPVDCFYVGENMLVIHPGWGRPTFLARAASNFSAMLGLLRNSHGIAKAQASGWFPHCE